MTAVRSVAAAAAELGNTFSGQLLQPGSASYEEARKVHNGAATRVGVDETAFPHRAEGYNFLVLSQWMDPAITDPASPGRVRLISEWNLSPPPEGT